MKKLLNYFSKGQWALWLVSVCVITVSFCIFKGDALTFVASIVGVTSLIFNAKGNPIGQVLMVAFSVLYGIISLGFAYYGEMITYLGMTAPMAVVALVSWLKNPYKGNRAQVKVNRISKKEVALSFVLTLAVTAAFYFVLDAFNTANMVPSTISVSTSFIAVYLTFRRSPYFALAYAANDVVLIVLWVLASIEDVGYVAVVTCFATFLVNDLYGFYSWLKMEKAQKEGSANVEISDVAQELR